MEGFPNDDLDEVILNKRAMTQMLVMGISSTLSKLMEVALYCLKIVDLGYFTDCFGSISTKKLTFIQIWIMLHSRYRIFPLHCAFVRP